MALKLPDGYEKYFKDWEEKIGAFIEYFPEREIKCLPVSEMNSSPLGGLPFAIKDNIALGGASFSSGSKLIEGLKAPYTATAVDKLIASGCVPVGVTNMDEFAMGCSTDNSKLKKTNNPWDLERVAGGSSGGSAAAVAAGLVPFALGSDTGGSVRQPAALCGVVGLKPTYGSISRYGLAALASSIEGIGIFSDTISRCRQVFDLIRGNDPLDETSMDAPGAAPLLYSSNQNKNADASSGRSGVIGVLSLDGHVKNAPSSGLEDEVRKGFEAARENLKALGYTIKEVDFPALKYSAAAYHTISMAEASANLARFDGIRFGWRPEWAENSDDLMDRTRSGFGYEAKLRILLGTYALRSGLQDKYYLRALRIRDGIRRNFENLLGDCEYKKGKGSFDALLFPVFPLRAFLRGALTPVTQRQSNLYACCVNLAGLPGLSFPASLEGGLPVGVQLIGRSFAEGTLLDIAESYEKAHPFPHPTGYKKFWN